MTSSTAGKDISKLRLVLVQGDDSTQLAGDYSQGTNTVRDKHMWICESKSRLMFYAGSGSWVITSTSYMQQVLDGATGGFAASTGSADEPYDANWGPKYKVSEVYFTDEGQWKPYTPPPNYVAPSVHIWWSSPSHNQELSREGITWYYNEITVKESVNATYFMTNGFTGGYMGIQDRSPKWIIFSIWDKTSTDDDPNASPEDLVKLLAKGEGVVVERFGGEGTGAKSYLPYNWVVGNTYQLMVNVCPSDERDKAIFTGWFRIPERSIWRMMASLQVRPQAASKKLEGIYSFIEDWIGNGLRRRGEWGPAWVKTDSGSWVQLTRGAGTTTEQNANNRNIYLSTDKKRLGMTSGGPPLADTSLGPYNVVSSSTPAVLTLNPLPEHDGDPARDS